MKNKIFVILFPFAVMFVILCISQFFLRLRILFPFPCVLYSFTGYYCPGCGGTRALSALLKGHIIRSFIDNPVIILTAVYCILLYLQLFIRTFFNEKKIIPDSRLFNLILSGMLIIYYLIRNFIPALYPV